MNWLIGKVLVKEGWKLEGKGSHENSYTPSTWLTFQDGFRRYLLARFPFSIIYKEHEDEVYIVAVMHNSRNPEYWKERVK